MNETKALQKRVKKDTQNRDALNLSQTSICQLERRSVLQRVAVCCSCASLLSVSFRPLKPQFADFEAAVCCSVLQCVAVVRLCYLCLSAPSNLNLPTLKPHCVAACCSVLQLCVSVICVFPPPQTSVCRLESRRGEGWDLEKGSTKETYAIDLQNAPIKDPIKKTNEKGV